MYIYFDVLEKSKLPLNIFITNMLWVSDAPLPPGFMRSGPTLDCRAFMTRCRRKEQNPQIHCDKLFPLFRKVPKDIPPPSYPIMTIILTWLFRASVTKPLCLTFDRVCCRETADSKQRGNYSTSTYCQSLCEAYQQCTYHPPYYI